MPLDIPSLSRFIAKAHWMKKHRSPWRRLLYRLAQAHLDLLTERAMTAGDTRWRERIGK